MNILTKKFSNAVVGITLGRTTSIFLTNDQAKRRRMVSRDLRSTVVEALSTVVVVVVEVVVVVSEQKLRHTWCFSSVGLYVET